MCLLSWNNEERGISSAWQQGSSLCLQEGGWAGLAQPREGYGAPREGCGAPREGYGQVSFTSHKGQ